MNNKKSFLAYGFCAAVLLCLCFPLAAGGKKESAPQGALPLAEEKPALLRASVLNGPSAIPLARLFENHPDLEGVESSFEVAAGPDILLPKLLKGEVDVGILPVNAAAKVYTANNGAILLGAITGNGMVSLVTKDASVSALQRLRGKRVSVAGEGATPDYLFRYLLAANNIPVGEGADTVTLDFSIPAQEIAPALIAGKIAYAVVPEPFSTVLTARADGFRRAIDMQKEFAAAQNDPSATYPMTALVVRAEFARQYPQTLRRFLRAVEDAIAWTNANPEEAGALVQKHTLGLQAAIAARAIPTSAFAYTPAAKARAGVERLLGIFLENAPASVGGKLPESGFYFE